jgi:serine protease SohB
MEPMPLLLDYAGFLAKSLTVLLVFAAMVGIFAMSRGKSRRKEGELKVTSLNEFYSKLNTTLQYAFMSKAQRKEAKKSLKEADKAATHMDGKSKVYVLDFNGDDQASAVESLRNEVTAILSDAKASDEVVVRLESPGGVVHGYGLAASQLVRIREAGVPLTICVDKVAASGGYMMACIANTIITAPFAILGSIGVVASMPNFHKLLKKHEIDFELITAGEFKRTLTTMGENTEAGRQKFQEEVDAVHGLFKAFVGKYRPMLAMDEIATGESWFGSEAVEKKLADSMMTSDEYLAQKSKDANLVQVQFELPKKRGLKARLGFAAASVLETTIVRLWTRATTYRGF